LNPRDSFAHHAVGWLLAQQRAQWGQAEKHFRMAIDLYPQNVAAHHSLGWLLAQQPERRDEAEASLRRTVTLDPHNADAHYQLVQLLAEQPERLQDAEEQAKKAIELNPRSPQAYVSLAWVLAHQPQRKNELMELAKKVLRSSSSKAFPLRDLFLAHLDSKDEELNDLKERFLQKTEENPRNAEAHCSLAFVYIRLKQLEESTRLLRRAQELFAAQDRQKEADNVELLLNLPVFRATKPI
jgi:tetratricopeptide (TPR) repeat protein